ncbi:MAG: toxin-antitoxin system YwqK family antitoxin [Flavobacteriaceae bacterium]
MKTTFFTLFILALSMPLSFGQNRTEYKKERKLVSVVSFHDNGQIAQKGYLKNNKLHGEWISFSDTGEKLAQGQFLKGKKIGKWFFWTADQMTEVTFKENKVIDSVIWQKETIAAVN